MQECANIHSSWYRLITTLPCLWLVGSYYLVYELDVPVSYHATFEKFDLLAECLDVSSHQVQLILKHLRESELYPLCEKFVVAALVNAIMGAGQARGPCSCALVNV